MKFHGKIWVGSSHLGLELEPDFEPVEDWLLVVGHWALAELADWID